MHAIAVYFAHINTLPGVLVVQGNDFIVYIMLQMRQSSECNLQKLDFFFFLIKYKSWICFLHSGTE